MKYSTILANRLTNHQRRLEDCIADWVRRRISSRSPLHSWECYAAMLSGAAKYPGSFLGLEEIRDLGRPGARQRWHQLFGDVCRDHGHQPIFPAPKGDGSSTSANVGFGGPQATEPPRTEPTADPQQKTPIPWTPQAAIPIAGPPMGDMS